MVEEARRAGAKGIAAVGTAGLRRASDSAAFVAAVEERCGVRIEVISGEDESRLAYLAAVSALELPPGELVVFDTGGGSSQFTFGHGTRRRRPRQRRGRRRALHRALRARRRRLGRDAPRRAGRDRRRPRRPGRQAPPRRARRSGRRRDEPRRRGRLGLAAYDPDVVQGTVLDRAEVDRQLELYRTRSADERRGIEGGAPAAGRDAAAWPARTAWSRPSSVVRRAAGHRGGYGGLRHGVLVHRLQFTHRQASPLHYGFFPPTLSRRRRVMTRRCPASRRAPAGRSRRAGHRTRRR